MMMVHTDEPGHVAQALFLPEPGFVGIERFHMTKFLKAHIDLLHGCHLTIIERLLPVVRFGILMEDEWQEHKDRFSQHGYHPVEVQFPTGAPRFAIVDNGVREEFEVAYTVFHESSEGTEAPCVGSVFLSMLLTDSLVLSPGVYTYAHIKRTAGP